MYRFIKLSAETQSAAAWCAARGHDGRTGSPLPTLISSNALAEINANQAAFALCTHLNLTRIVNDRKRAA